MDWSITGAWIERVAILLGRAPRQGGEPGWLAESTLFPCRKAEGSTPPESVCRLLVALAEDGRLRRGEVVRHREPAPGDEASSPAP